LGLPLDACRARSPNEETGTLVPHLYALVAQPTRGEVAVLDLFDQTVVDADPARPGFNFLPVGARPVDIVATSQSTASFVAVAEPGRPGVYALPAPRLRGANPDLLSWPACSLPAAPGAMTLVASPSNSADACPGPNFASDTLSDQGDPAHPNGDLRLEAQGAQKLYVTLPNLGELLVLDAQKILDRPRGSFDLCPIERRFRLATTPPPALSQNDQAPLPTDPAPPTPTATSAPVCPAPPAVTTSAACQGVSEPNVAYPDSFSSQPVALVTADNRLYIADRGVPLVHVFDTSDPCAPIELPGLQPTSVDEPTRPVVTSTLAVSPLTTDNQRFLYAVDATRGSVMVFDITKPDGSRTPLVRSRPDLLPLSAPDRLALNAPVRSVTFTRIEPYDANEATGGVYTGGITCDPQRGASTPGARFQTNADFTVGAAPTRLRGTFAVLTLMSGQLVVVDVDDLDAPCRRAQGVGLGPEISGCDACLTSGDVSGASGESSCRAVVRHEVRSGFFIANNSSTGPHAPTFQAFPLLSLNGNNRRTDQSAEGLVNPKLLGPAPPPATAVSTWTLERAGTQIDVETLPNQADKNFILPDLREPRGHVDQDWSFRYEGVLPGFEGRAARGTVSSAAAGDRGFFDPNATLCELGVHDYAATRLEGARLLGVDASDPQRQDDLNAFADTHTDVVEITQPLLGETDAYWPTVAGQCGYLQCLATFGLAEAPTLNRSAFRIREAYQDRLLVDPVAFFDPTDPTRTRTLSSDCCFPTLVSYQVRASQSWVATGSVSGFVHRTVADPTTYRCVDAGTDPTTGALCEARFVTRTGRAYEVLNNERCADGNPQSPTCPGRSLTDRYTFHNPFFFSVLYQGTSPSTRNMTFSWRMTGGFSALLLDIGRGSAAVAPRATAYSSSLQQLLVSDGAQQGVVVVDMLGFNVRTNYL